MLQCSVCGDHYWPDWHSFTGEDNAVCDGCLPNFAGAYPPLEPHAHPAREALEAYVGCGSAPMTPRQAQAIARLAAVWHRQAQEEDNR